MAPKKIIGFAFLQALTAAAYIALVALFFSNAERIFGPSEKGGPLTMIFMLTLLVVSVAMMGILIFMRPTIWYFNGLKAEAIKLLVSTIIFLFAIVLIVFSALMIVR